MSLRQRCRNPDVAAHAEREDVDGPAAPAGFKDLLRDFGGCLHRGTGDPGAGSVRSVAVRTLHKRGEVAPLAQTLVFSKAGSFARRVSLWLQWRLLRWEEQRLEDALGTETRDSVALSGLTVVDGDAGEGFQYVGEHPRVTRWWLRALPGSLEAFTFVDLGSGKGRVLFMAAELEFRQVVGVEFAQELHEVTVENAARVRASTGREIVPLLGDAGAFAFPLDPLVVHLNNPFTERVMSRVIRNLAQSYAERPRPIVVVYQQARQEDDATDNVARLAEASFLAHRSLVASGMLDRFLLKPWIVDIFESPEARS